MSPRLSHGSRRSGWIDSAAPRRSTYVKACSVQNVHLHVCRREIRVLFFSKQKRRVTECLVSCLFVRQSPFIHLKQHDVSFIVVIFVFMTKVSHSETVGGAKSHKKPISK